MSIKHPVFAVTGSSGAGTSTVREAMEHIFRRDGFRAATVEGDCFHKFERTEMKRQVLADIDTTDLTGKRLEVVGVFKLINPNSWLITPVSLDVQ